ncbi:hypothetical protein CO151_13315 [bacterium CG_4_9_14_3_um_filter_65_15]|nr:MAG: hypothetical protein CO151_13315 [bacterium CG_4_9_14_3_um_filter_65_15]
MKRIALLLPLCLLLGATAEAQTPLALTNIGQRLENEDARMTGRGGWGMAVDDSTHPGFQNLASLYSVRKVALSFSAYGEQATSEDAHGTRTTSRVFTPDFRVALPVFKGRLAVTAGFVADRSSQYDTSVDSTWNVWSDTISGKVQFLRDGSVFRVPLGVAFSPRDGISLAAALNLQNGTLRESLYNLLQDPSSMTGVPFYQTNLLVQEDTYSGTSATFSALLKPTHMVRFGLSYTPAYDLDVDRKMEMGGVAQRATTSFRYSLPAEYRTGLSFALPGRWRLGADYQYRDFRDFTGEDSWAEAMEAEHTLSFGVERVRAHARHGGWNNLPVRFGFRARTWAYQVGGSPVEERTFSAGTGFPFRGDLGQLDMALSYSLVGNLDDNGMESRILRLTLSVTGLERWW